jgi:uncharacterized membrane protein (UPF0182 family)
MNSAEVFYNRQDLWQFPRQPTGGNETTMVPYYIIVRLPGEAQAEFLQMLRRSERFFIKQPASTRLKCHSRRV